MHFKIGTLPLVCRILAFLNNPKTVQISYNIFVNVRISVLSGWFAFYRRGHSELNVSTDTTTCNAYGEQYVKSNRTAYTPSRILRMAELTRLLGISNLLFT